MKFADELKRLSRRNQMTMYYEILMGDLRREAFEGGNHKIITLSSENYNPICHKLLRDGFEVIINNYNPDNMSHMTYIIWDKDKFNESLKDAEDIDPKSFHYGLI